MSIWVDVFSLCSYSFQPLPAPAPAPPLLLPLPRPPFPFPSGRGVARNKLRVFFLFRRPYKQGLSVRCALLGLQLTAEVEIKKDNIDGTRRDNWNGKRMDKQQASTWIKCTC